MRNTRMSRQSRDISAFRVRCRNWLLSVRGGQMKGPHVPLRVVDSRWAVARLASGDPVVFEALPVKDGGLLIYRSLQIVDASVRAKLTRELQTYYPK